MSGGCTKTSHSGTQKRTYDLWHDRAVFHFLTDQTERAAYVSALKQAVSPEGWVIIGTFALDGPERCSGLPVARYSAKSLSETLGEGFALVEQRTHRPLTPSGAVQMFQFSLFRRKRSRASHS